MTFLALSPILLFIMLLFVVRWPLFKAAPIVFLYTTIVAITIWKSPLSELFSAVGKGGLLSLDIIFIILGAVVFLRFLEGTGQIVKMQENLKALSPDPRLQAVFLAWFFGSFIEGISGFGTPAVIVAPLLVGIGFSKLTAISIALLANSTAVTFGAVGTPVRIGFADLHANGLNILAAKLSILPGILVPVMILGFYVQFELNAPNRWRHFR